MADRVPTEKVIIKGKTVEVVSAGMENNPNVALEICNQSKYNLKRLRTYLVSGMAEYPPHQDIQSGEKSACGFCKRLFGMFGCYGLLCYSIQNENKELNIMFCNPYVPAFYYRKMAIQLYNTDRDTIPDTLLTEMYNCKETSESFQKVNAGAPIATLKDDALQLKVTATMMNAKCSIIRIHLTNM